jgi:hypothetical protein
MAYDLFRSTFVAKRYTQANDGFSTSTQSVEYWNKTWSTRTSISTHARCHKGSSTAFGVSVQTHELKFTHKTRLLCDLSKFCGVSSSEIRARLQKSFGGNRKGFAAEILVGETKPFIISYDKNKYRITLSCRYGCWNNFGYGFHE